MTRRYVVQSEPAPLLGTRYWVRDLVEGDVEDGLVLFSDDPQPFDRAYVEAHRMALRYNGLAEQETP